jgi:hypothetical protein
MRLTCAARCPRPLQFGAGDNETDPSVEVSCTRAERHALGPKTPSVPNQHGLSASNDTNLPKGRERVKSF